MARLNTRPSSRHASATPQPGATSDQENYDPQSGAMDKGKGRAANLPVRASLPTPASDSSNEARGQKRKRARPQRRESQGENEDADDTEEGEEGELNDEQREAAKFSRYFDPNQNPEERRNVKRQSRALEREVQERRDDFLRDSGKELTRTLRRANQIYRGVKQTNDATLDSRLLVNVSDLAHKKTAQLVLGDASLGIDVDEFLSKCISYMRNGGPIDRDHSDPPSTSRRRAPRNRHDSDGEEDDDLPAEPLHWEFLGRHACFPYNSRPCVPSFLLGPLSVEKKHRTQTQRRARQSKDTAGREARPEALSREDLSHSDENGLTAICKRINVHLRQHITRAEKALDQAELTDLSSERAQVLLKKYRITDRGGPNLFDYVLNPRSFGQTVENLFYVSFLIKEGVFGIENDSQGMPCILATEPSRLEEQRRNKTSKHQAVFSLDYETWQKLVDAFEVEESLIEHRREDEEARAARMGERGWYA